MKRKTQAENHQAILDAMPGTKFQLAERVGQTRQSINRAMETLFPAETHISEWNLSELRRWEATYTRGRGASKARPPKVGHRPKSESDAPKPRPPARYDDTVMPRAFFGGVRT